jgi:D-sedoheptulose 7-phosphate isomerase
MTQMEERVRQLFGASIEAKITLVDSLSTRIAEIGLRLVNCLLNDGRLLLCGNGGSAANGLHFSAAMLNHFEVERPPLPVMVLSTDASVMTGLISAGHSDQIFARQIQALGQAGDVLLLLSTSGNADNLLQAVNAAHERDMDVVALTGRDGGVLANHFGPEDLELRVQGETDALIREIHLFILHCFCDLIDQSLFGQLLGDA